MNAPIIIDGSFDLLVSNGTKDLFCDVVVDVARIVGLDLSGVYENAPGIAGTYGVSGLGLDVSEFFPYFGGRAEFRRHLDVCSDRLVELDLNDRASITMSHVIAWAKYKMDGGVFDSGQNFYDDWPPVRS